MSSTIFLGFFLSCLIHAVMPSCLLPFQDCGSTKGQLLSAKYNGTCSGPVAQLKKGTTANIIFEFKTKEEEATLTSEVSGKISPLPYVPFPLPNPNACLKSNLKCPVAANTDVSFSANLPISKNYPSVNVEVKWQLENSAGEDVFCALLLASIVG